MAFASSFCPCQEEIPYFSWVWCHTIGKQAQQKNSEKYRFHCHCHVVVEVARDNGEKCNSWRSVLNVRVRSKLVDNADENDERRQVKVFLNCNRGAI